MLPKRLPLIVLALFSISSPALGQGTSTGSADSLASSREAPLSLARPWRAGIQARAECRFPTCDRAVPSPAGQDSTQAKVKRGKYALWGLAVGAGLGWLFSYQACQREECYGMEFGLTMVAGGALGLIVGLLVSPG